MEEPNEGKPAESNIRRVRHDIRNQLSNINLSLEQLRYEIPDDVTTDSAFYINTIAGACAKINMLLDDLG
ncbi:MAG: hypothetical protein JSU01_17585 [Bacteroidetes bacterium]|nr:hypothetical protein [Bacteroidota bacterium]